MSRGGGFIGLVMVAALVLVPASPAAAIQTITWVTSPPATGVVGQQVSFAFSGTANTFLGARITGCFINFPDGNNYTNSFGGNFTTGNCSYNNRALPYPGTYPISSGFTLSTGGTMAISWNVAVSAPNPSVSVPSAITTQATSVNGAVVTFVSSASDSYYGSYASTCSPASGSTFPVATTTVSCSATNPNGKTGTASFAVTVTKSSPALLWSPPISVLYGATYGDLQTAAMQASDATGTITYTRADGSPFAASDVIPVGDAQVLRATYVPSGGAVVAYNQVTVERTITVARAVSAVSFGSGTPTTKQYGAAPFTVAATGTSGAGAVTVTAQAGSDCTVSSSSTGAFAVATVTITGAGSCVLLADQAGTSTHSAAPSAQWSVTIAKANPQINWAPPSNLTYGEPVSDLLGATADVPGTFAFLVDGTAASPHDIVDAGEVHTVSVTFTPDDLRNYVEATADYEFSVSAAEQTLTLGAVNDQTFGANPFDLVVGGTGPGVVSATAAGSCTVDGLTVTVGDVGTCAITVDKAATSNYLAATSVVRTFAVQAAAQSLAVAAIADMTFGDASFILDVTDTGAGVVSATAVGSCTVDGLTVSVGDVGTCTITVGKAATSNYLAATSVVRMFAVLPAAQTVTVATIADRIYGDAPFSLDVASTGPGFVSATAAGSCTVDGSTVTVGNAGTCSITVGKAATANYSAAAPVVRTFTVQSAAQALTVAAIADKAYGSAPFVLDVAGAGPGVVTATAAGSCTVDGLTVTVGDVGTCSITVGKAATANYSAATPVVRTFAVQPAAQALTVAAIADKAYGAAPFSLVVGGSGPGPVSATVVGSCTVDGLVVTVGDEGTCTITVDKAATNNFSAASSVTRTFTVTRALPVLTGGALPAGKVGASYSTAIVGGTVETTVFAISSGALPAGLILNPSTGVISGTPQASGPFEFTVKATTAGGSVLANYTIQVSLPAGKLSVATAKPFTSPGNKVTLTISGLAPGEPYSVSLRGVVLIEGIAPASGKQIVTVTIPKTTVAGKTFLVVTGSTAERAGQATQTIVPAAKKLTFTLSPRPIVQANRTLTITVQGLAAGEPVTVTFRGKTVSPKSAKADSRGKYTVKVSAGWSWGYKPITATGSSAKRYGATRIDVEARR